jgi:hypothetical protein
MLSLVVAAVIDTVQMQYDQEEMVIHQDHVWAFVGESKLT